MTPRTPFAVQECSPSARVVYLLLDAEGALSQQRIRSHSGLSEDTCRRVLDELEAVDAVIERPDPADGRRQKYVLGSQLNQLADAAVSSSY